MKLLLLSCLFMCCMACKSDQTVSVVSALPELSDTRLTDQLQTGTHLVHFTAVWCVPCLHMKPAIKAVRAANPTLVLHEIDTDHDQLIAERFDARELPVGFLIQDGHIVARYAGYQTEAQLQSLIDGLPAKPVNP